MKKNIALLSLVCLLASPLFARPNIRENGGFRVPAAAKLEFYSPGNGIDYALKAQVDELVQAYMAANLVAAYTEKIVGMEGETNVCVLLADLESSVQLNEKLLQLVAAGQKKTRIKFVSGCEEVNIDDAFRPRAN
jgi:hypothetical protein